MAVGEFGGISPVAAFTPGKTIEKRPSPGRNDEIPLGWQTRTWELQRSLIQIPNIWFRVPYVRSGVKVIIAKSCISN